MTVYQATDGSVSVGVHLRQQPSQEECCEAKGIVHTFLLSLAVVVDVLVMLYDVSTTKIMLCMCYGGGKNHQCWQLRQLSVFEFSQVPLSGTCVRKIV